MFLKIMKNGSLMSGELSEYKLVEMYPKMEHTISKLDGRLRSL
jgi:hypothetical protein